MAPSICVCIRYFVIYSFTISGILGVLRPRGVSLPRKIFYNPSQKFSCLDGSGSFPFHFVNDDFCDCDDGSDEPGTPACSNGIFHCLNHGHVPKRLPSSRINDGICDCCDTSDEYNSTADCFNNCKELGQQAFLVAKMLRDHFMKGHEMRNDYIKKGKEKKEEYKALLDELYKEEQNAMKVKNEKQDEKEYAETKENAFLGKEKEFKKAVQERLAAKKQHLYELQQKEQTEAKEAFDDLDVNKDKKLTASELKSFTRFDYDQDGKVSDNEAQFYMHKKEEMTLEEFLENGWKIMKPAFTIEETDEEVPFDIVETTIDVKPKSNSGESTEHETSSSVMDKFEKDNILKDAAVARKDYADADKLLQDIQAEIWHLKRKLNADFGTEDEFLMLENQCFELSDKKYMYKLCPFDKIVQMVKVNQDETLVGLWDKWSGPDDNHYLQMKFARGTSCWNGPNRSAEVTLKCGTENKVTSVMESSPCSYVFEFTTPALCKELPRHVKEILKKEIIIV